MKICKTISLNYILLDQPQLAYNSITGQVNLFISHDLLQMEYSF